MSEPFMLQEIAGAARVLSVSEKTARRYVDGGLLKPSACFMRGANTHNLFSDDDIDRAKRELELVGRRQ
jgi:DNA-binding transcriptional MerR regulator